MCKFREHPATTKKLNSPTGVAVDGSGNVYVADTGNHRVRKVAGGTISTIAGNGTPGSCHNAAPTGACLNSPNDVHVDTLGNVYVADTDNHRVAWVDGALTTMRTVAGTSGASGFDSEGGAAASAKLNGPRAVFADVHGHLLIADTGNHRVRVVTPGGDGVVSGGAGELIATIAGGGFPTPGFCGDGPDPILNNGRRACLNGPSGVAYYDPDKTVYIADQANQRVRAIASGSDLDGLLDKVEDANRNGVWNHVDSVPPPVMWDPAIRHIWDPGSETNLYDTDTDDDGCADSEELGSNPDIGGGRNNLNPYDFYDITDITGVIGSRDKGISGFDSSLLSQYGGAAHNGGPHGNGKTYDPDLDGDTIADGLELDFTGACARDTARAADRTAASAVSTPATCLSRAAIGAHCRRSPSSTERPAPAALRALLRQQP